MKELKVFFDMDGVLAEYQEDIVEHMHKDGYFKALPANKKAIKFVKDLEDVPGIRLYILSKTPNVDAPSAKKDKMVWLNVYLPEFPKENILIQDGRTGKHKGEFLREKLGDGFIKEGYNILIDDYTKNLVDWETTGENFIALKALNGVNNKKKTHKAYGITEVDFR